MNLRKFPRAIVLGGGICGLATATVLGRHFEQVTVIEQDRYSDAPAPRLHAPQGAHIHILLAGGLLTLTRLVPRLPSLLDDLGVQSGDLTEHTRVAYNGRWLPRVHSGIPIRVCTRGDVEQALLRDARTRPQITLRDGTRLLGLAYRDRVTGVRVAGPDGIEEELSADLVVDTMGRSSCSVRLLGEMGLPAVDEIRVDPSIGYATAWFEEPAGIDDDWGVLATLPAFPNGAQMSAIIRFRSSRRLHCSVITYGKPQAPRSPEDLVARLGTFDVLQLHRLLQRAKPLSDVALYGNTQNRWRRFGRLSRFPDGLVILGDAACSLNPRYGQGMTVAALSAEALERELAVYAAQRGSLHGFSHHFQRRLESVLTVPWQMALLEDRLWVAHFSGQPPSLIQRVLQAGSARLLQAAFTDIQTYIAFMRVAHLLSPPTALLTPRTFARMAAPAAAAASDATSAERDAPGIGPA